VCNYARHDDKPFKGAGMARKVSMKMIPAMMLVAFSGAASASGFQLMEQNASGIGNSYAGSAAVAENASTIYFNPAGMTQLQDHEISGGMAAIRTSYKFSNNGSTAPSAGAATGSDGGDAGGWGFVPNGYASWALTKDVYAGIGISSPFGLKTEYASDWVGRFQSVSFDIKTVNVNPSIAYRVNDKVSLGFGVNWQQINAEYVRQANASSQVKLKLDDSAWGWNAGALFTLSPSTKVGVSYRSAIKYSTTGSFSGASSDNAKADLKMPDTFILSVTQKLSDKWEMLGDVSRTGWSSIPKVEIMNSTTGSLAQTLDTSFRSTWRVALGTNYKYTDAVKLKFGVAFDQAPVQSSDTRMASLPDNNRVWLSTGAQYKIDKASAIDVGIAYLYLKDSSINNNQDPTRGVVNGTYSSSAWIMGAQYSLAF
jgi:long-chain fatty acid transport protein